MIDTNDKMVWVINKSSRTQSNIIMQLKKQIHFEPGRPVQLPFSIAQKYLNYSIRLCDNPDKYFKNNPLKHLTIRDAGIGDLLLLEPWLRASSKRGRLVSIASCFPDIFKHHPNIVNNYKMKNKKDEKAYKRSDFDADDDLRNYSESCSSRAIKHRTDCYGEKYNFDIPDIEKEPRLYFSKNLKSKLEKKKGKKYIGISLDASHRFRRYLYGEKLINYILKQDSQNVVVLLGSYDFIKEKKNNRIIDFQGKTNVEEMTKIVADLDYLIAVDSGIMHVGLVTHTPTVCLFGIIKPELRLKYYTGEYRVLDQRHLDCVGCGSFHMAVCKHEPKNSSEGFVPPCMDIDPKAIYDKLIEMKPNEKKRIFYKEFLENVPDKKQVNINFLNDKKLTVPVIVLNEEHNLPRFIENIIQHKSVGRVVAIDGGSTDKTVELLKKAGAEVYIHPYIKTYHEQQAMQRNISCSYVKNGEPILLMDIDECFSKELSDYLPFLAEQKAHKFGLVYRKTFNYYADINDDSKAIKDWPDPQPRYYIWDWSYKFVGGAHHKTLNVPEPLIIDKPIIHFEKEGKDRKALEKQWSDMMNGVKKYV